MEKISINPSKVRGYGNILSPHSSSDYSLEDCTIEAGTDTVNGATETVYTLTSTASHSYSLSFGSASYTAVGGACTVTVTLTDGGVAVQNATISVSGGTGGSGSGTTNSSGVASINVTGITASGTLTASFQSATATASVTYSSYLFYDDCSSSSGLTNYGSSQLVRGSTATITMSYDSTENAYKVAGSGNYHAMIPITPLANQDEYIISMDCKGQAIRYNMVGFFLDNSADTTSYGLCFGLDIGKADNGTNQSLYSRLYRPNSDGSGYITYLDSNVLTADKYYNLRFTVNGSTLTGALYDGTTKLAEKTVTYTINNKSMGILLFCEKGTTQSACYVKNIVANTLTPTPTPVADSLAFSQSTYTADMLDGVTVSCTLKEGNTPVSGATITLQSTGGLPINIITNSNGVATHSFDYLDLLYPDTVTATYQGVTATCTIMDGGGLIE